MDGRYTLLSTTHSWQYPSPRDSILHHLNLFPQLRAHFPNRAGDHAFLHAHVLRAARLAPRVALMLNHLQSSLSARSVPSAVLLQLLPPPPAGAPVRSQPRGGATARQNAAARLLSHIPTAPHVPDLVQARRRAARLRGALLVARRALDLSLDQLRAATDGSPLGPHPKSHNKPVQGAAQRVSTSDVQSDTLSAFQILFNTLSPHLGPPTALFPVCAAIALTVRAEGARQRANCSSAKIRAYIRETVTRTLVPELRRVLDDASLGTLVAAAVATDDRAKQAGRFLASPFDTPAFQQLVPDYAQVEASLAALLKERMPPQDVAKEVTTRSPGRQKADRGLVVSAFAAALHFDAERQRASARAQQLSLAISEASTMFQRLSQGGDASNRAGLSELRKALGSASLGINRYKAVVRAIDSSLAGHAAVPADAKLLADTIQLFDRVVNLSKFTTLSLDEYENDASIGDFPGALLLHVRDKHRLHVDMWIPGPRKQGGHERVHPASHTLAAAAADIQTGGNGTISQAPQAAPRQSYVQQLQSQRPPAHPDVPQNSQVMQEQHQDTLDPVQPQLQGIGTASEKSIPVISLSSSSPAPSVQGRSRSSSRSARRTRRATRASPVQDAAIFNLDTESEQGKETLSGPASASANEARNPSPSPDTRLTASSDASLKSSSDPSSGSNMDISTSGSPETPEEGRFLVQMLQSPPMEQVCVPELSKKPQKRAVRQPVPQVTPPLTPDMEGIDIPLVPQLPGSDHAISQHILEGQPGMQGFLPQEQEEPQALVAGFEIGQDQGRNDGREQSLLDKAGAVLDFLALQDEKSPAEMNPIDETEIASAAPIDSLGALSITALSVAPSSQPDPTSQSADMDRPPTPKVQMIDGFPEPKGFSTPVVDQAGRYDFGDHNFNAGLSDPKPFALFSGDGDIGSGLAVSQKESSNTVPDLTGAQTNANGAEQSRDNDQSHSDGEPGPDDHAYSAEAFLSNMFGA